MTREEIKNILPHREPMLLLDTASCNDDGEAKGTYTVRGDEWFLQGHFPGNPVVPGVILCEMMAQNCCALIGNDPLLAGSSTYFTSLDKARFKALVKPGDRLDITCRINKRKGPFFFAEGKIEVGGKLCATAEFSFMITK